jgi:hypothetical protein
MADGPNVYLYVNNNPVNLVDPWGLMGERRNPLWDDFWGTPEEWLDQLDDAAQAWMDEGLWIDPFYAAALAYAPALGEIIAGAKVAGDLVKNKGTTGIVAKSGTKITGFKGHGVDRAIGDAAKRAGTRPQAILDALKNPTKVVSGFDDLGRPFEVFTGQNARVVVNPQTGKIISVNPLSGTGAHMP